MIPLKNQVREFVRFKPTPMHRQTEYDDGMEYEHYRLAPLLNLLPDVVEALEIAKSNNVDMIAQMNQTLCEICPNEDCDYQCLACQRNRDSLDSINFNLTKALAKIKQAIETKEG